jgi:superfamily II DNA helicase RecQ
MHDTAIETRAVQKSIPSIVERTLTAMLGGRNSLVSTHDPQPPSSEQPDVLPHPPVLPKLRRFLQNRDAQFTCPEQAQALEAVLYDSEHVLLIGPTGMGKSSVFLIPAKESQNCITIVLIPLSSLRFDFERRCGNLGIQCDEWFEHTNPKTEIVMVSPENAARKSFLDWAIALKRMGKLARLVYDEAHMVCTQAFRDCFDHHTRLAEIGQCVPCESWTGRELTFR